ncbi:putative cis-zeatin O-glucosyltransferase [Sorghum bicolor]|uniref:Glycosyltransferase n=1 Tax=Sorghum bicolor TaxID=4558 RepID=Q6JAG7_SORBI|nr:putative cis-zeatin O-glucosyltransferase [Sorghum bicolor]AAT42163.1 putative cis-zeatin O-glucosyltransferase [Sorghum bicolor]KXG26867.1 hypothetical protein SORBI_3006G174300 [Sorghum bicolor]|eukprot:XP_002448304.2 putative cis-zeatin O-glucosyltransferase [Sorghum bicolor]
MESVTVVAVPFPAQGHLNQLLHLSLLLAARGLPVHYAAPAEHVRQARARVHGWGDAAAAARGVEFHELAISEYVSPLPDPAADSPFPSHLMLLWEAFAASAPAALAALLGAISASHRRVVVLYDLMNAFAAKEAARLPNGEGYTLHCTAVSSILGRMEGGSDLLRERGLEYLPINPYVTEEFLEFAGKRARAAQTIPSSAGIVMNSCHALEGEFIDFVAQKLAAGGKKVFCIGPLNPLLDSSAHEQGARRHECLVWLDRQPPASVLYVSFGSTSSLRGEQIAELAAALRGSNQRFIWVLRDADRGNIFADNGESRHAKFLSEFAKETEGTGLVITGWAPQLEILAHGATAAFMSHCGWNSTVESMSHGKPILAWPMHSDQPWDAELVCEYLKAGFLVRPCEKHAEVIPAATIQEVIERMMVSDEGLPVRQRATAIGEAVRSSAADGGTSFRDLENFIAHITR